MVRNRKTVLPLGHRRKYTSNGTSQVSQADRIKQNEALMEAGKRHAEKEAAAAIAAAQAEAAAARKAADAEREKAAALDSRWQKFNDTNLAEAVRQKDAAQWKAALHENSYKEVYATAQKALNSAARMVLATSESASIVRKAGDAAHRLLVSDHNGDRNLNFDAAMKLSQLREQHKPIARIASNTLPLAEGFRQLREIDKRHGR